MEEGYIVEMKLTSQEIRILGCLMEKSVVTPDQYPLSLNSLTNACNQKSSRDPVMTLDQGEVQKTTRELKTKHLVRIEENFKTGVEKYTQTFCNTNFGDTQLDSSQFAIICLLMLRGPQTPGELRSRSGRLHHFEDNAAVVHSLNTFIEQQKKALIVKLPKKPGRKDSEYMHLLSGPIDMEAYEAEAEKAHIPSSVKHINQINLIEALTDRVARLETEVEALKANDVER